MTGVQTCALPIYLDHATARRVFELMLELNASLNTSLVIVTHDREMARQTGRVLTLEDGRLVDAKEMAA